MIDAVVEHVVWSVDDLVLLVRKVECAVTLDLGTVGYLRQDGTQLGKVIEEALLLDNLILATPLLVKLIWQEVESWQFVTSILLGYHGAHFYKGGGGIDAGLFQLNGDDDGISLEDKRKQALERETARSVNNEVEVLGTHGPDKVTGVPFAVELGTGYDLVQGLELRPPLKVLLLLLDDASLRIRIEHDKAVLVLLDELVGEHHAVGGLAAAAFLVGEHDDLVFLGVLPNTEKWNAHKALFVTRIMSFGHLCYVRLGAA